MDLQTYQTAAGRTVPELSDEDLRTMCGMGLIGEYGELVDMLKKRRFHGHTLDRGKLRDEFGDVCWYLSLAATLDGEDLTARYGGRWTAGPDVFGLALDVAEVAAQIACPDDDDRPDVDGVMYGLVALMEVEGFTLSEVLEHNIAKLQERYKDGFSHEASRGRL